MKVFHRALFIANNNININSDLRRCFGQFLSYKISNPPKSVLKYQIICTTNLPLLITLWKVFCFPTALESHRKFRAKNANLLSP